MDFSLYTRQSFAPLGYIFLLLSVLWVPVGEEWQAVSWQGTVPGYCAAQGSLCDIAVLELCQIHHGHFVIWRLKLRSAQVLSSQSQEVETQKAKSNQPFRQCQEVSVKFATGKIWFVHFTRCLTFLWKSHFGALCLWFFLETFGETLYIMLSEG